MTREWLVYNSAWEPCQALCINIPSASAMTDCSLLWFRSANMALYLSNNDSFSSSSLSRSTSMLDSVSGGAGSTDSKGLAERLVSCAVLFCSHCILWMASWQVSAIWKEINGNHKFFKRCRLVFISIWDLNWILDISDIIISYVNYSGLFIIIRLIISRSSHNAGVTCMYNSILDNRRTACTVRAGIIRNDRELVHQIIVDNNKIITEKYFHCEGCSGGVFNTIDLTFSIWDSGSFWKQFLHLYRWCDNCLFTTNPRPRDWFYINKLEWTTAHLYGSLQGLCNMAGVSKAHALTKHNACANCWANAQLILQWCMCIYCGPQCHRSHHL